MFKSMLHKLAAKTLALALVLTAAAPLVGAYNFTEANELSDSNSQSQGIIPDLDEAMPLNSQPDGATLKVSFNIPEGSFTVYTLGDNNFVTKDGNCGQDADGYTCSTALSPNGYNVKFNDVENYQTPGAQVVQIDGYDDHIFINYIPLENNAKANFVVRTQDNQGNALNEKYVRNGGNTYSTPNSFTEELDNLNVFNFNFNNKAGYTTPGTLTVINKTINNLPSGVTVKENGATYSLGSPLKADATYEIMGTYTKIEVDETTTFQVLTEDNQGNPLNEQYIRNTLTTHTTPHTFVEKLDNLNTYSFQFKAKAGYSTPGTVYVNNKVINNIPANVTITENGAAYAVGTALKADATYRIVGTYVKQNDGKIDFTVNKTVTNQTLLNDGNKRVDYEVTVIRTNSGTDQKVAVTVKDSISGNKKLYGSNGGVMEVVGNGTCSNGCGDITDGPVTINMNKGQTVTLKYTLESNNSTIPEGESSNFINTIVGNFTDQNGNGDSSTDKETVTVDNGDDIYVSVYKQKLNETLLADGNKEVDYRITVQRSNAGVNKDVEVVVKDSISGNKKLYGSNGGVMEVVGNGTCSNGCGDITDGPISVELGKGEKVTLNYTLRSDNSTIPAGESSNFKNTVVANYDNEDGDDQESNDDVTVTVDGDDALNSGLVIDVTADKSQAKKGECVLYTISATNTTNQTLTGLILTLDYDQVALDVTNTYGGTDNGSVVTWNHGTLTAGNTARHQMGACVTNDANVGAYVRTTARGLVNEIPNVPGDDHDLLIVDPNGTAPTTPTPPSNTNSGMGSSFLLLLASAASYLVYQNTGRRRYSKLKAEALK